MDGGRSDLLIVAAQVEDTIANILRYMELYRLIICSFRMVNICLV